MVNLFQYNTVLGELSASSKQVEAKDQKNRGTAVFVASLLAASGEKLAFRSDSCKLAVKEQEKKQ